MLYQIILQMIILLDKMDIKLKREQKNKIIKLKIKLITHYLNN